MIDNFAEKVSSVLTLLKGEGYVVPTTGSRIFGNQQAVICDLINDLRRVRRLNVNIHLPAVNMSLNHPEKAAKNFFEELTTAIGLSDLGFDEALWEDDLAAIHATVRTALAGGVMATIQTRDHNEQLFQLNRTIPKGIDFDTRINPLPLLPSIREFTVEAKSEIATSSVLTQDAFLRVIAAENGEFLGMNGFLGIPDGLIERGTRAYRNIPTSADVARTTIFAFASSEPCFHDWPLNHLKSERLNHGRFQKLLDRFMSASADYHETSVQSFITTYYQQPSGTA